MINIDPGLAELQITRQKIDAEVAMIENEKLFKNGDYLWFTVLSVINLGAIGLFLWHWFSRPHIGQYPMLFLALTFLLLLKLAISQMRWYILPSMKKPLPIKSRPGWKVAVVTTVVPRAESLKMLERTVKALMELKYPHETWVLDEDDDPAVKAMCKEYGATHFSRKNLSQYQNENGRFQKKSKHGNYNAWLTEVGFENYDIIAAFDPDHVPEPAFLNEVIGFFDNPEVGYVQLPQVYYNQDASFVARGAAEETYAYYSCSQTATYALGHPMIIGSHNTHRVEALKQIGGFAPHAADDLLITLYYRTRGWRGIYLPQVLAQGLAPVNWGDYLSQQLRWAESVLDIKLRYYPKLVGRLAPRERTLRLIHGLNFVEGGITTLVFLVVLAIMLITGKAPSVISLTTAFYLAVVVGVLLLSEFFRQRFYIDPGSRRTIPWRATLMRYAKWPYLFWAFCKVVEGKQIPLTLTPKAAASPRRYILLWPHLATVLVIGGSWLAGVLTGAIKEPMLHILAGAVVIGSATLILSEFCSFPPAFDTSWSPYKRTK